MNMQNVTIYDIASALNISASTVSRALSDSAFVKKSTRRRVLMKAVEMGYQQNVHASMLGRRNDKEIKVIVPDINNEGVLKMLSSMGEIAERSGFKLVVENVRR